MHRCSFQILALTFLCVQWACVGEREIRSADEVVPVHQSSPHLHPPTTASTADTQLHESSNPEHETLGAPPPNSDVDRALPTIQVAPVSASHRLAQSSLAAMACAAGEQAEREGNWGAALLWYMRAQLKAPGPDIHRRVRRMRQRIFEQHALTLLVDVKDDRRQLGAAADQLQNLLHDALHHAAPQIVRLVDLPGQANYSAVLDGADLGITEQLVILTSLILDTPRQTV